MKSDRHDPSIEQADDLFLRDAFRSVRSEYDGEREEADLTLQRALFQTRVQKKRQRIARWVLLPAAAVLVASTAWAGVTGKLPSVSSVLEVIYEGRDRTPPPPTLVASSAPATPAEPAAASITPTIAEPPSPLPPEPTTDSAALREASQEALPVPSAAAPIAPMGSTSSPPPSPSAIIARPAAPASSAAASTVANAPIASPPLAANTPAPASSANDPHAALFAEAHRLHFSEHDPARALAAWDKYLDAAPTGRFAPEARYNRALALVRLGRRIEAQQELAVFANGIYGEYRRADAKALLDALARDASRP